MAANIINELFEVVVQACDSLYGQRKLITHKAVMEIIEAQGRWSREYLEKTLPQYINDWRLQNLNGKNALEIAQQQMAKYESDRAQVIKEIREMLAKMGRGDV